MVVIEQTSTALIHALLASLEMACPASRRGATFTSSTCNSRSAALVSLRGPRWDRAEKTLLGLL